MAGLRKFVCYRRIKRAYTRVSKYKKKGFIKARPKSKVIKYEAGDAKKKFGYKVHLITKDAHQIRDSAIEASRLVVMRHLAEAIVGENYFFQVKVYPHHVLRENKLLTGAGADRMQTGMSESFGVSIGLAAQVKKNKPVFTVKVDKENIDKVKSVLELAKPRLPGKYLIVSEKV